MQTKKQESDLMHLRKTWHVFIRHLKQRMFAASTVAERTASHGRGAIVEMAHFWN